MSKAILVMKMPDSCIDCPCYKGGNVLRCGVDLSSLTDKEIRQKPNWCPLHPVPKKKKLKGDVHNLQRVAEEIEAASWSACKDVITGET